MDPGLGFKNDRVAVYSLLLVCVCVGGGGGGGGLDRRSGREGGSVHGKKWKGGLFVWEGVEGGGGGARDWRSGISCCDIPTCQLVASFCTSCMMTL